MSEQETSNKNPNLSLQKVLLPGHDPGWNDPPKWAYCNAQTSVTPTKRVLNKRVAFPLAAAQTTNKESPLNKPLNMPPLLESSTNLTTASHPPLLHPSNISIEETSEIKIDKDETLNNVLTNMEAVINKHVLEKSKAEEVRKRLDVLKVAWNEDKLNNMIYKNILDLSTALQEGNVEKADEIHVALMMQHASLCSAWIPGIRHIILELKTKLQNSSVTQLQGLEPHLLPFEETK